MKTALKSLIIAFLAFPAMAFGATDIVSTFDNVGGYWELGEASGVRYDYSANGNHLTDNNTVGQTTTSVGAGADFEESNSEHLSITDANQVGLEPSGDWSVAFFYTPESNPSVTGHAYRLISKDKVDGGIDRSYLVEHHNTSNTLRWMYFNSSNAITRFESSVTFTAGTTYAIVISVDVSAATTEMWYKDVSSGGTITEDVSITTMNSAATSIDTSAGAFEIGADTLNGGLYTDGVLQKVLFTTDMITSDEADTYFNAGSGIEYLNVSQVGGSSLDDNLVAYFPCDEASGVRYDFDNVNDLTDNNTVGSATGVVNDACDFELDNSEALSITDGNQTGLDITGDISFSLWFNLESAPSNGIYSFVNKWTPSGNPAYLLDYRDNGGTKTIRFITSDGSTDNMETTYTLSTGSWQHLAVSWDASESTVSYYLDGELIATETGSDTSIQNGDAPFGIGGQLANGANYFDGDMDEVMVFNGELSYGQVVALYNGGSGLQYGATPADFGSNHTITIESSQVSGTTHSDFPVYIDLSDMPAGFWSAIEADGASIRMFDSAGTTELPYELVNIDTGAETGELHFLADSISGSSDTDFKLYYGLETAQAYANESEYGRNNVWADYELVLHFESDNTDSTGNHAGSDTSIVYDQSLLSGAADVQSGKIAFSTLDLDEDFSLQMWVNRDADGGMLMSTYNGGGTGASNSTVFAGSSGNQPFVSNFVVDSNADRAGDSLGTATWKMFAITYSEPTYSLLVNGATQYTSTAVAHDAETDTFNLFSRGDNAAVRLNGKSDEIRLLNSVVLTEERYETEYNNQSSPSTFYSVDAGGGGGERRRVIITLNNNVGL